MFAWMFGSIVPVEVSCLTPDTTSNGDWGFPPPPRAIAVISTFTLAV